MNVFLPRRPVNVILRLTKMYLLNPEGFRINPRLFSGSRYFINLCQGIHGGVKGCPEDASVCRRSAGGLNQTLGRVYTQKMSYEGECVEESSDLVPLLLPTLFSCRQTDLHQIHRGRRGLREPGEGLGADPAHLWLHGWTALPGQVSDLLV